MKSENFEELHNLASVPKSLLPDYQRLLSSMPSCKLNTLKLIWNSVVSSTRLTSCLGIDSSSSRLLSQRFAFDVALPPLLQEWDASMLSNFALEQQLHAARQEPSHVLYQIMTIRL
ncbi:hypothetical protein REPUB_Repub19eG0110500 [Reevesia pubescens]